jgi:hypothetical protein
MVVKGNALHMTADEWRNTHRDFKGFAESDGTPTACHFVEGRGTCLFSVVVVDEQGQPVKRQPHARRKAPK